MCFPTKSPLIPLLCRKSLPLSQQPLAKISKIFAHFPKTPYLCQRKQAITPVTAKTRSLTIKNYKIMKQMNEMSARALTMEELENVNGGRVTVKRVGDRLICC
jgi:flagellar biosynthesis/type III secretory pathway chaperone